MIGMPRERDHQFLPADLGRLFEVLQVRVVPGQHFLMGNFFFGVGSLVSLACRFHLLLDPLLGHDLAP